MVMKESEEKLERGEPVPNFELRGTDGETHSLADFADYDAVLLVFTCNHCPYAQAKFDLLNDVAAEYDDAAVVGVNPNDEAEYPDDSSEKMVEYVEDGTIRYDAYLRDDTQEVAEAYGAACTPDPFLLRNSEAQRASDSRVARDAKRPSDHASGESREQTAAPRDDGGDTFTLAYHGRLDDAMNPDEEPTEIYVRDAIDAVLAGEEVELEFVPSRGCSIKWK